jgi:hypothetical protein
MTDLTYVRTVDTYGATYRVYDADTFAFVALVYDTGTRRRSRAWRATLTRGAYPTRHAAAQAALAQGSASRHHADAAGS